MKKVCSFKERGGGESLHRTVCCLENFDGEETPACHLSKNKQDCLSACCPYLLMSEKYEQSLKQRGQ